MDLYEALLTRRTIYKFEDKPVPEDVLERALEAGRWAPNHRITEPWRFTLVGVAARETLGRVADRLAREKAAAMPADELARQVSRAVDKVVGPPTLLVVSCQKSPDDTFREREDYAACACAVQNIMLSLWADDVGCQWGTGGVTRDLETYGALGIDPAVEDVIGLLKIGYPTKVPAVERRPLAEVLRRTP
jgi:nitroreductase